MHGQHYRTQVRYKIRRNRFSLLARPSNTNSRNHQQIQHNGSLPAHSGHTEHPSRQTQSSENPSIRVEASQEVFRNDPATLGEMQDRCIRSSSQ